ncbi:MAG: glycosyl transferase [Inquilinus sp.]|nr:glycosyl transferase [Inquilinus sp.]
MVNVVCMKWGTLYGPHYVDRLYRGIARHLNRPFRFVCFTDDPSGIAKEVECLPLPPIDLPPGFENSALRKISLFAPTVADLVGPALFLDLDVVIVDDVDCFFDHPGEFGIIRNWIERRKTILRSRPRIGNSSAFRLVIGDQTQVFDEFQRDPERAITDFPTEQAYMTSLVRGLTFWPDPWCRSFKRHCVPPPPFNLVVPPRIPIGTRIVVFHGRPNPDEAAAGFRSTLHRRTLPASWIGEHWK